MSKCSKVKETIRPLGMILEEKEANRACLVSYFWFCFCFLFYSFKGGGVELKTIYVQCWLILFQSTYSLTLHVFCTVFQASGTVSSNGRLQGRLEVSRAFGDRQFKKVSIVLIQQQFLYYDFTFLQILAQTYLYFDNFQIPFISY